MEYYLGQTVPELFTVYEADGKTPHSGLGAGAFTFALLHNGVPSAVSVSVVEVGTSGLYKATYVPDAVGRWYLRETNTYSDAVEVGEVMVVQPVILGVV